ncbi:MAG: hypothetical protein QGI21_01930 [Candidatus Poseidoniaceae archaeon]|jgi:hypothetical protein|nr:hypothetical protein [Candidatus Poseidoniaceae archaeon]
MEILGPKDWEEFLNAPIAVLVLGKAGCAACEKWSEKLSHFQIPDGVRIGKIMLDAPGFGRFKIANEWVANVDALPFNTLYINGEIMKSWAGGGLERLQNRLNRFI